MKSTPTTSTTNSSSYIDPWLLADSQSAGNTAMNLPQYTAYTGPNTQAGLTANQTAAGDLASSTAGTGQNIAMGGAGTYGNAMNFALPQADGNSINATTNELVNGTNSATQNLINANNATFANTNAIGLNQLDNNLAGNNAFGGTRQAVADAALTSQNTLNNNQTNANILANQTTNAQSLADQLFGQNSQNALNAQGVNLQGASGLTNLGQTVSGLNSQDISNLANTGATAQTTNSGQNQFLYNQYLQGYQIPDTQATTEAGILGALPHDSTANSQTQSTMYTNPLLSLAGIGLGIGALAK